MKVLQALKKKVVKSAADGECYCIMMVTKIYSNGHRYYNMPQMFCYSVAYIAAKSHMYQYLCELMFKNDILCMVLIFTCT